MYTETMVTIKKFMQMNKIPMFLQTRTNNFLISQWYYSGGLKPSQLFSNIPTYLYEQQQVAKFSEALKWVPLFQVRMSIYIEINNSRLSY